MKKVLLTVLCVIFVIGLSGCMRFDTTLDIKSDGKADISMLYAGGYPYPLKKRIASDRGHLSNEACSAELPTLARTGTTRFVLGHLSAENNMPILARQSAVQELGKSGIREGTDYLLAVAGINGLRSMVL